MTNDIEYWSFKANDEAKGKWTSGKQFMRVIGEIIQL
jgi:hypothetical protein